MISAARYISAVIAIALSVATYLGAQQINGQAPSASNASLSGRIIDGTTGRPVPSAAVAMFALSGSLRQSDSFVQFSDSTEGYRVIADEQGQFVIRNVPKGLYTFNVFADGFMPGGYGQSRPWGPTLPFDFGGEPATNRPQLTILIWRTCVIEGTVVDESGEPVVLAWVSPLRRTIVGGQVRWLYLGRGTSTDDRGRFRISALWPSDYKLGIVQASNTLPASLVSALASPPGSAERSNVNTRELADETVAISGMTFASLSAYASGFRVGNSVFQLNMPGSFDRFMPPAPEEGKGLRVYPTTFAPGVTSSSEAQVWSLTPGAEVSGITFQIRPAMTVSVSGVVRGPIDLIKNLGVVLIREDALISGGSDFPAASTLTDATGSFRFLGIPSGQYRIHVLRAPRVSNFPVPAPNSVSIGGSGGASTAVSSTSVAVPPADRTYWATRVINVGSQDVSDLSVDLQEGFAASGTLTFAGKLPRPSADQVAKMSVSLVPVSTVAGVRALPRSMPFQDGQSFTTLEYEPGLYRIRVEQIPSGWFLKSASYQGQDVSDAPFEIVDRTVSGITISIVDSLSGVSGTVRTKQGEPMSTSEVIVFPADQISWQKSGVSTRRSRVVRANQGGAYIVLQLPPGDYYVVALDPKLSGDRQDPKLLQSLTPEASRIRLGESETKTLDLQVVSAIR